MKPRYSGSLSNPFWNRVERIPLSGQDTTFGEVYALGCALQDLERRVLATLRRAEAEKKRNQRG